MLLLCTQIIPPFPSSPPPSLSAYFTKNAPCLGRFALLPSTLSSQRTVDAGMLKFHRGFFDVHGVHLAEMTTVFCSRNSWKIPLINSMKVTN